jgi:beta-mannosidase
VTPERYRRLVEDAAGANMNMLRVWGGGIYEDDLFYDLCDERGILVWQDFMFANAMYPGDSAFTANVGSEIIDAVKRLRDHPSIALWCGNNEISEGWHRWGWQDGFTMRRRSDIWDDYRRLFQEMIPRIVDSLMHESNYWESSPLFGRGDPRHQYQGDAHYWGVWHDAEPFEMFEKKVPRFMSEFGFQSFPEMASIEQFVPDSMRYRDSPALRAHEKHPRGFSLIDEYIGRDYRPPKDFASLVYLSQVVQAEGITRGIEAERRARPRCMGSLYWQLDDCWPAVSWSSIDYYGRWKALHYYVKRAYRDLIVSFESTGDTLFVYAVSDRPLDTSGDLRCVLMDFMGTVRLDTLVHRIIPANRSTMLRAIDLRRFTRAELRYMLLSADLLVERGGTASGIFLFDTPKNLPLTDPAIECKLEPAAGGYRIVLRARAFAKNVCLRCDIDGAFSDNYFDLLPGTGREIFFSTINRLENNDIHIVSLKDSYTGPVPVLPEGETP